MKFYILALTNKNSLRVYVDISMRSTLDEYLKEVTARTELKPENERDLFEKVTLIDKVKLFKMDICATTETYEEALEIKQRYVKLHQSNKPSMGYNLTANDLDVKNNEIVLHNQKKIFTIRNKETGRTMVVINRDIKLVKASIIHGIRMYKQRISPTNDFYLEIDRMGFDGFEIDVVGHATTSMEANEIKNQFLDELRDKGLAYNQRRVNGVTEKKYKHTTFKVVKITNTVSGKIFISSAKSVTTLKHTFKNESQRLADKIQRNSFYKDILALGIEKFKFDIIFESISEKEAREYQSNLISEMLNDPKLYNVRNGREYKERRDMYKIIFVVNKSNGKTMVGLNKDFVTFKSSIVGNLNKAVANEKPLNTFNHDLNTLGVDAFDFTVVEEHALRKDAVVAKVKYIRQFKDKGLSYNAKAVEDRKIDYSTFKVFFVTNPETKETYVGVSPDFLRFRNSLVRNSNMSVSNSENPAKVYADIYEKGINFFEIKEISQHGTKEEAVAEKKKHIKKFQNENRSYNK